MSDCCCVSLYVIWFFFEGGGKGGLVTVKWRSSVLCLFVVHGLKGFVGC